MPEALAIKAGTDILFSEFLQTGLIYIQTASSMIPAKVLEWMQETMFLICVRRQEVKQRI